MIPVRLEIQGLYSYREKQIVEFDQLTGAGLFGIFGAVGSGKSSILEAILLALYGSTERLSDRGEKNSMLNLQSDQVLINFEFRAGKNNAQTYLARYCAKRNPKNFEDVKPAEHTFYERVGETWEALSQRGDEIVGMQKGHFKQTVIIPQGKFREFIDLTPGPRAEMMKELFGLERFDLSGKTGSLLKVVREEKIRLETQLSALESFTKENLEEKEDQFSKLKANLTQAEELVKAVDTAYRAKEVMRTKHQELLKYQAIKTELLEKKPAIESKRQLHQEFITAKTHLKPTWEKRNDARVELEKYTVSVEDCIRFKDRFEKEVAELEKEEVILKEKTQQRPQREAKIRDLKKVLELQVLRQNLNAARHLLDTLQPSIEEKKKVQKSLKLRIQQLEEEIEKMPSMDSSLLAELKSAERDWKTWEIQLKKLTDELEQLNQASSVINQESDQLLRTVPQELETLENWLQSQKNKLTALESERDTLIQKQGLAAHVHLLHDEEACPLCGALEHPDPLLAESEVNRLNDKNKEISSGKALLEQITNSIQRKNVLAIHQENNLKNTQSKKSEIDQLTLQIASLKSRLASLAIETQESLSNQIQQISDSGKALEKLQLDFKTLRKNYDTEQDAIEKAEVDLNQSRLKVESVKTGIRTKEEEIKDPVFCDGFYEKDRETILQTIQKVEKDIEEAIQLLEGKQKHLREKRGEQTKNLADLDTFSRLKKETGEKLIKLQASFEQKKTEFGFTDEAALIRLFEQSLDAEKVLKEITQFDQDLAVTQSRIQELEENPAVSLFEEESFLKLSAKLQLLKSEAENLQNQFILLGQEIKEAQKNLAEKTQLEAVFSKLQNRESYLRELDVLFRGSGFVKYVSSIYLKELCNTANVRFMKLSKNSLSLEIDDDNTFWVIDYLNGGKRRLLKTLSGGQTFQASLCLALALAEKVKALNQADQSFFFLDEGFGALDRNALRVVFETLKSLRHENRIVGIISHVEELQQEVGVYAQIELDPEKGSQVSYSF
ncbi:SbcC/MukB-like Walker B domain-containing protein [Algoriphagus sp.]|uniref:SbcC/MukB-like Walker B domain-containing protein n=1 Tax=Algoriphagus sp. TaxID=1872435 RepID=UPI00391BF2A7